MAKSKKRRNLFKFLQEFIIGIKNESKKIMWTSKKHLFKYSLATLFLMIFTCLYFVGTDLLIALIAYVKELLG